MSPAYHFTTGQFTSYAKRIPDAEYARALDSLVIACTDCVLVCEGKMLIGQRTREPQANWWVIGGRMQPGETFEQTAARHCQYELGLRITPERFRYLNTISQVWSRRAQPPREHGCHMVAIAMLAEITPAEREGIKPNDEYRAIQWRPLREITEGKTFHPSLRQCAADAIRSAHT